MLFMYRLKMTEIIKHLRRDGVLILTLALSGGLFGTGLLFFSLTILDSGVASLLEKLQPISTLVVASFILQETIQRRVIPYMALALLLAAAVSIPDIFTFRSHSFDFLGMAAAIGASIFYGTNTVLCKVLMSRGVSPKELAFFRMGLGSILILPVLPFLPAPIAQLQSLSSSDWCLLILVSLTNLVWAFNLFLTGLTSVTAGVSSFLELISPIVALALGYVFLSETLSDTQMYAIPALILCIFAISKSHSSDKSRHSEGIVIDSKV
jgi:probable blue pigment (indigoidine) exporter